MGIIGFVKNIFGKEGANSIDEKVEEKTRFDEINEALYDEVKDRIWSVRFGQTLVYKERILTLSDKDKVQLMLNCVKNVYSWYKEYGNQYNSTYSKMDLNRQLIQYLFRTKILYEDGDFKALTESFLLNKPGKYFVNIANWPIKGLINHIGKSYKGKDIPLEVVESLDLIRKEALSMKLETHANDMEKLIEQIDSIVYNSERNESKIKPILFLGNDDFQEYANQIISNFPTEEKKIWYLLISQTRNVKGSKPSGKFLDQSKEIFTELGSDKFKKVILDWFNFIIKSKEKVIRTYYNQDKYYYESFQLLAAPNAEAIKGFVWMCSHFHDTQTLQTITALAERCYKKIPGQGQAAAALGNACVYTLYKSKGLEGIGYLSKLKLKIKLGTTQNLIEKYLAEAAASRGITIEEIEDLAMDDYGLKGGQREYDIEGYKAVISIEAVGKVNLNWYKPGGEAQKSDPAVVKEKQTAKLKKIKNTVKLIASGLITQRDRLDRSFKTGRKMVWGHFQDYYLNHGLMGFIAQKQIWHFEKDKIAFDAIWFDGKWINAKQEQVHPEESFTVSLWHPAIATTAEVQAWRAFLIEHQILQPLKQAFREIYLLTDAEVNTRIYSNRMASHILRQHQFNSLAKLRGWKYLLRGNFDGNYDSASINLLAYNLRAEYWINEINADETESGIWSYISTDQVRFIHIENDQVADLIDIPVVAFSEIMRDVDLFVGVASIGNDPNWRDGGVGGYNEYWESFSFGELTEVAKSRKEILERLVPRLKIAKVAHIKDKFLVVQGKIRTYKIHLGSTNILMEPNDQYLCIVPERSAKNVTANVFLPFEGDSGLSVIISKALMLAEDDKIQDPTILSQLKR